jgi:Protein of unknown function (DUF1573)
MSFPVEHVLDDLEMIMRVLFIAVGSSFLLFGVAVWFWPDRGPGADNVVGSESYIDLRMLEPSSTHSVVATVANPYAHDVTVTRISTSCGCTSATMKAMTIPAGETRQLDVVVNVPNQKGSVFVRIDLLFDNQFKSVIHFIGKVE